MKESRSSRGSVDWNKSTPHQLYVGLVAPLVGAWIEIILITWTFLTRQSRSSRGSVDWNSWIICYSLRILVAPLVGAWIEIILITWTFLTRQSRSSRGSVDWNLDYFLYLYCWIKSLLSWERGLKSYEPLASLSQVVSLLSWERGLKSDGSFGKHVRFARRSSRGSVDWNKSWKWERYCCSSRSSRGSVDWNISIWTYTQS